MKNPGKLLFLPALTLALLTAGCHKNDPDQVDAADNGNLAPVSDNGAAPVDQSQAPASAPAYSAPAPAQQASAAPSYSAPSPQQPQQAQQPQYQDQGQPYQSQNDGDQGYEQGYQDAVAEYATEPPPPLPEYQQPPCPEPNYIWTPGYWSYAQAGYYWVPGVWAAAPYVGALWTPGYWGYNSSRYGWHQGYWGRYIGYYGGVNYGNGYVGRGYYGGYWNNNQFNYNRQVTNINTSVIHNTYIRNVTNVTTYNRVSYNGGRGGVNLPPSPAELAGMRQPRLAPRAVQEEHRIEASTNRAQFAAVNRGQPQTVVVAKPLPVEHHQPALAPVQPRQQPRPP